MSARDDRIHIDNVEHGLAIARAASTTFQPTTRCIARVRDGELLGGVLYENNTGASILAHMAGFTPDWVNRDLLWVSFHYPFIQLGVRKMFGQVAESNRAALEFNRKLGFKEEHRIKDVFPDGDMILLAMYRDDCRWLRLKPRHLRYNGSEG